MATPKKFKRVWIDTDKTDGVPGPWKRGWQRIVAPVSWRTKAKAAMDWGLRNTVAIHYSQHRPFNPNVYRDKVLPASLDCSGSVSNIYKAAGRPDPTGGKAYSGGTPTDAEFTGTLRKNTPQRKSLRNMRIGDFFVHGPGTGAHTTVVYRPGKTPGTTLVWSHGQEAGPLLTTLATQMSVHGDYYTMHDGGRIK